MSVKCFDPQALLEWLIHRGASEQLLARVRDWPLDARVKWESRDVYLVLCGLLIQVTVSSIQEDRIDALKDLALALGYREIDFEGLLSYALRITERRLRAFAVLGLGLHATAADIKVAHRQLAKTFHPDRLREGQSSANRMLSRLNQARALLLRPTDDVLLGGEDDIWLGEPRFESEDAPTEEYTTLDEDFTEPCNEDDPTVFAGESNAGGVLQGSEREASFVAAGLNVRLVKTGR